MRSRNRNTHRPVAVARVIRVDETEARETREFLLVVGAFLSGMLAAAALLV